LQRRLNPLAQRVVEGAFFHSERSDAMMEREERLDVFGECSHTKGEVAPFAPGQACENCADRRVLSSRKGLVTTTLLVLLVGEFLTPFQADFREALPHAFPEGVPEVGLGLSAPPGRTVAWVTVQAGGLEIEVVLHTARIPGDLRRVLRFTAEDAARDRAKAAAFTLAAMVRERDSDLKALEPPKPQVVAGPTLPPLATPWVLDGSLLVGFNAPGVNAGGGARLALRRELAPWLQLGVGVELGVHGTTLAALVQPALYFEGALQVLRGPFSLSAVVGGGVAAPVLIRGELNFTTWLGLVRVGVEGRLLLGAHHGFRFALSTHLLTRSLSVRVGEMNAGAVGPAWIRPEVGYFGEL